MSALKQDGKVYQTISMADPVKTTSKPDKYNVKSFLKDFQQRLFRAGVLKQTAKETGPSGGGLFGIPGTEGFREFGVGETIKGLLGQNRHDLDKTNPAFTEKMNEILDRASERGVENPYINTLGTDEDGKPYRFPDTKQERTGHYVDKTPLEAPWSSGGDPAIPVTTSTPVTETPTSTSDKVDNFLNKNDARTQWLQDTSRSPAARAKTHGKPTWSDEERWQIHLKNQQWRKNKGRNFTHGEFLS